MAASIAESKEYIFVVMLGLFIGSTVGAMAQITPYAFMLLSGMAVVVLAWRQEGSISVIMIMLGLLAGSLFGNMASVTPYGITMFLGVLLAMMVWRTQGGGMQTSGPTSTIGLILFTVVAVGILWNGTHQDFCNPGFIAGFNACLTPGASGYITAWQGCVSTCSISAVNIFGLSPFTYLISGDFVGFIQAFITGAQSPFNLAGFITPSSPSILGVSLDVFFSLVGAIATFVIGAVLLVLGTGIGASVSGSVLASGLGGAIQPNEAGTRLFQSLGIGLILWAVFTGLVFSGGWFAYLGFGLGTSGTSSLIGGLAAGGTLYVMFLTVYTFELYRQGKTITA